MSTWEYVYDYIGHVEVLQVAANDMHQLWGSKGLWKHLRKLDLSGNGLQWKQVSKLAT